MIVLSDRIKEISHSVGNGNIQLEGAATGFSSFDSFYGSGDFLYYAITDGVNYEVGSGEFVKDGSHHAIARFPFDSSNSDALVDWEAGVKEVFVTYPGKSSVFSASGVGTFQEPAMSGLAFWGSRQILDYNSNLVWNTTDSKLGILTNDPQYTIDVGGSEIDSTIRSSGMIVGDSGIMFSGVVASGGRQIEPFLRSQLDNQTGTDAVFSLSGLVDERLLFEKQVKGFVLAGPASGCTPTECSPNYPTFRYLTLEDIPNLSSLYTTEYYEEGVEGNILFYKESGVYQADPFFTWKKASNRLGLVVADPQYTLDVNGTAGISGDLRVRGDVHIGESSMFLSESGITFGGSNSVQLTSAGLSFVSGVGTSGIQMSATAISFDTSSGVQLSAGGMSFDTISGVQVTESGISFGSGVFGTSGIQVSATGITFGTTSGIEVTESGITFETISGVQVTESGISFGTGPFGTSGIQVSATGISFNATSGIEVTESGITFETISGVQVTESGISFGVGPFGTSGIQMSATGISFGTTSGIEVTESGITFETISGVQVTESGISFGVSPFGTSGIQVSATGISFNTTSGIEVTESGITFGTSGIQVSSTGISTTNSPVSGIASTNTVINSSGFMMIPGYSTSGEVITAMPPSLPHSGVFAVGGTHLMWCNGTTWLSGILA